MKLAIISDIHANLIALQRVLKWIEQNSIDTIVCLGDIVGYYTWPNECCNLVREHCKVNIIGNHDLASTSQSDLLNWFNPLARFAIDWTREQLTPSNSNWLQNLPLNQVLEFDNHRILLCHGAPENTHHYLTDIFSSYNLEIIEQAFDKYRVDMIVAGHTHRYANETIGNNVFLNPGSVGQPRDGTIGTSFAVWDSEKNCANQITLDYDIEATQQGIYDHGLPEFLAHRLSSGT